MLNITPSALPSRRPHLRQGLGNSPMAHMALSMLILALGAGTAIYRITMARERAASFTPETFAREQAARLHELAEGGQVAAQLSLADAYASGVGVLPDQAAAARWNRAAAERGAVDGQLRLARAYVDGRGVTSDIAEAAGWMKKAAEKGSPEAQCAYGIYRFLGVGTQKDIVDGYRWLAQAAAAGSESARMVLDSARKQMTPAQIAAAQQGQDPLSGP